MGIVRGDGIVAVAADVARRRARRCSSTLVDDERELVTVHHRRRRRRGDDHGRSRRGWPSDRPGVEVEVHDGGQPLYPYLFGVE